MDLNVSKRFDGEPADVRNVVDALPVDDQQRRLEVVADLALNFAEQLVDGADAIALDRILIEAALGRDVAEPRRRNDDDFLLVLGGGSNGCVGRRRGGVIGFRSRREGNSAQQKCNLNAAEPAWPTLWLP